jgi:hypothetical protein
MEARSLNGPYKPEALSWKRRFAMERFYFILHINSFN